MRREAAAAEATRSTISGVQSIGSSELMRNVTSASIAASAHSRSNSDDGSSRSRPYDPRWTPVSAISLKPACATRVDLADDLRERQAAAAAAGRRDDAVGTLLFAAGLHAQRERRAAGHPGSIGGAARPSPSTEPFRSRRARGSRRDPASRRCGRRGRRWQRREFVGPARGVTAGGDDLRAEDSRARCGGSSAARPGPRSPSPNRC